MYNTLTGGTEFKLMKNKDGVEVLCNHVHGYAFHIADNMFYGTPEEFETHGMSGEAFTDRTLLDPTARGYFDGLSKTFSKVEIHAAVPRFGDVGKSRFQYLAPNHSKAEKPLKQTVVHNSAKEKGKSPFATYTYEAEPAHGLSHVVAYTEALDKLMDNKFEILNFYPQQMVLERTVDPEMEDLANMAFNIALNLQSRGIAATETTELGSAVYGQLFLFYVAVIVDLFYAMDNKISFFLSMPGWYWEIRSSLGQQVARHINFKWNTAQIGDIADYINQAPLFQISNPNNSLAWGDGTLSPDGQYNLVTSYSPIDVDDLIAYGPSLVATLFIQNEKSWDLIPIQRAPTVRTAAAFAQVKPNINGDYDCTAVATCEVPLDASYFRFAEMKIASKTQSRVGRHQYQVMNGPAALMYLISTDQWQSRTHHQMIPKPISITMFLAGICAMMMGRDILESGLNLHGTYAQITNSMFLSMSPGQYLQYVVSLIFGRYRMYNTWFATTTLPQPRLKLFPVGSTTYNTMEELTYPLPTAIVENLAKLCALSVSKGKGKKTKAENDRDFKLVYVPVLVLDGIKTNANPLDNAGNAPTGSVASLFNRLFLNVTLTNGYNWGTQGGFPSTLDVTNANISMFDGPGPRASRATIAVEFNIASQNWSNSAWSSNINPVEETLLYYSQLTQLGPVDTNGFDKVTLGNLCYISHTNAFDPRAVSDSLCRILPIQVPLSLEAYTPNGRNQALITNYCAMTEEPVSSENNVPIITRSTTNLFGSVGNKFNDRLNETPKSDEAKIVCHTGGGFISNMLGHVMDHLPKIGKLVGSIISGRGGKREKHVMSGVDNIYSKLGHPSVNPYHPLLRLAPRGSPGISAYGGVGGGPKIIGFY